MVGILILLNTFTLLVLVILIVKYRRLKSEFEAFKCSSLPVTKVELPAHLKAKYEAIENSKLHLINTAVLDGLTGVLNKGKILSDIGSLIADNCADKFAVLMFDIDNFKKINDTHGHLVGDECIKQLADIASSSVRGDDLVGRYGGDEFIVVLRGLNSSEASIIANRFRLRVNKESSPTFSVSIGVASYPDDGNNVKTLLNNSDKALYKAKELGKNAVASFK
jgi:diguanylate cyclase (GGDEF)-like protein